MNNITVDRIQSQIKQHTSALQAAYDAIKETTLSPPISLEELRTILMTELEIGEPPPVELPMGPDELQFNSIYDFSDWYQNNQTGFNDNQRQALDTILQVRQMIDKGCACRRSSREHAAHAYFSDFWTKNQKTDLAETIARIGKVKRVRVASFCEFPTPKMDGQ